MNSLFISQEAELAYKCEIKKYGHIIEVQNTSLVYEEIQSHSDIYLVYIGEHFYCDQHQGEQIIASGQKLPENIIFIEGLLGLKYPSTIPFNHKILGDYVFHHEKYIPEQLKRAYVQAGKHLVHVKQGYAGCSILKVDENHLITADKGIARIAQQLGIKVLRIEPGHIKLSGQMTGFIGGCGIALNNEVIFHGQLSEHPQGEDMKRFIYETGKIVVDFNAFPLTDIGGVIHNVE